MNRFARTALALVAGATLGVPQAGAAAGCRIVTDPAGDVAVSGTPATVPDGHLDVRSVDVDVTGRRLRATFQVEQLTEGRLGEWLLTFTSAGRPMFVGAGLGMWVNAFDYSGPFGYVAGVTGRRVRQVSGNINYTNGTIVVDAPLSAFGGVGSQLGKFRFMSRETFLNTATADVQLSDEAASDTTFQTSAC